MTFEPEGVRFFAALYVLMWGHWPPEQQKARPEGMDAIAEAFK